MDGGMQRPSWRCGNNRVPPVCLADHRGPDPGEARGQAGRVPDAVPVGALWPACQGPALPQSPGWGKGQGPGGSVRHHLLTLPGEVTGRSWCPWYLPTGHMRCPGQTRAPSGICVSITFICSLHHLSAPSITFSLLPPSPPSLLPCHPSPLASSPCLCTCDQLSPQPSTSELLPR